MLVPDDYFRPTNSWIKRALHEVGFQNIKIIPLAWGPFSTGLICSRFSSQRVLGHISLIADIVYLRLRQLIKGKALNKNLSYLPIGYFIEADKLITDSLK